MTRDSGPSKAGALRLDVWLWRARLFKTRSLAAARILEGGVRLGPIAPSTAPGMGMALAKPSSPVRIGCAITMAGPDGILALRILALPARRGPPAEGRACYSQIADDASTSLDGRPSQPSSSTSFDF